MLGLIAAIVECIILVHVSTMKTWEKKLLGRQIHLLNSVEQTTDNWLLASESKYTQKVHLDQFPKQAVQNILG